MLDDQQDGPGRPGDRENVISWRNCASIADIREGDAAQPAVGRLSHDLYDDQGDDDDAAAEERKVRQRD